MWHIGLEHSVCARTDGAVSDRQSGRSGRLCTSNRSVIAGLLIAVCCSLTSADVIVTLEARDSSGRRVTDPVPGGTDLVVDVLLSVDAADDPLDDVRAIVFDFGASGNDIELGAFVWRVSETGYAIRSTALPTPSATTLAVDSNNSLLTLTRTPVRVATIDITVNDTGTLNAVGPTSAGRSSEATVTAGFSSPVTFALADDNLLQGTLEIETSGGQVDSDGDGVPDSMDAFPNDPNESLDTDGDRIGNNADPDDDGDGVLDALDAFPLDPEESADSDGDGVGDNADAFPNDPAETLDTDNDGIGNNADPDDDGDGVNDDQDAFPLDPTETRDSDGDGVGDNAEMNSNMGPRATGSLCGVLSSGMLVLSAVGMGLVRRSRRYR